MKRWLLGLAALLAGCGGSAKELAAGDEATVSAHDGVSTAYFDAESGEPIGSIPAGTKVRITAFKKHRYGEGEYAYFHRANVNVLEGKLQGKVIGVREADLRPVPAR